MYKKLHSVHRHATKSDNDDRLSTKLHFFFASCKLFQDDRSSFDFFCNFVGREGGVSDMRFHHSVATCLWLVSNALTHCRLMQICHPPNMLNR